MQSVANTIKKYALIKKGDVIGCAVSGGSDSMCLLHYLFQQSLSNGYKVVCLNVEHGIRGESSKNDTQFVKEFCQKNNIEFLSKSVDVISFSKQKGLSIEQAARELRYDFFNKIIFSGKCNFVATGHHKSDNVESILMHMFRGSGLNGLTGIKPKSSNGYIRPLINTTKQEILQYLEQNNIRYITDESNFDNVYRRNNLRNTIIPLIKDGFDGAEDNIIRLSQLATQENDLLNSLAEKEIIKTDDGIKINTTIDKALLMRGVMLGCKILGAEKDISFINISDAANLTSLSSGSSISLGSNVTAFRDYDCIFLSRDTFTEQKKVVLDLNSQILNKKDFEIRFLDYNIKFTLISKSQFDKIENKFTRHSVKSGIPQSATLYLDADKLLNQDITLRTRKDSDYIRRINGGKKLISDYLTDIKLHRRLRDNVPLLCNSQEVLAVFPLEIGETIKINSDTINIFRIDFNKRGN